MPMGVGAAGVDGPQPFEILRRQRLQQAALVQRQEEEEEERRERMQNRPRRKVCVLCVLRRAVLHHAVPFFLCDVLLSE